MSTLGELFAARFVGKLYDGTPSPAVLAQMAKTLGVDSLRYLSVGDLDGCLDIPGGDLCKGCVSGSYPTEWGNRNIRSARRNLTMGKAGRTYE
jgi:amidophosphoribosyltransferase